LPAVAELYFATVAGESGPGAAAVRAGRVHPLRGAPSMRSLLADWEQTLDAASDDLAAGRLGEGIAVDAATLLPPVPDPPNLYMAGANYADHAREMRRLAPDAPIDRPLAGPFFFLKPTTTLIGHRAAVELPASVNRLDWEVELAAVIGRRAHRVDESRALEYVAGYTVVNDVSARDRFVREGAEAPMTYDWIGQKAWHTSCPAGPWLLPARDCPDPGSLSLRLTVNGEAMQDSNTAQMIFSLEEQIAYLSSILPLVPGDIIATGTCAGVGAGRGRFLAAGDTMVAEIESIGALENPVQAANEGS
jgi:2-keto-4-pentenoate hydratase/2-oxohepta-3-ene-1,7-dioic acid hydratase in catechol pathway